MPIWEGDISSSAGSRGSFRLTNEKASVRKFTPDYSSTGRSCSRILYDRPFLDNTAELSKHNLCQCLSLCTTTCRRHYDNPNEVRFQHTVRGTGCTVGTVAHIKRENLPIIDALLDLDLTSIVTSISTIDVDFIFTHFNCPLLCNSR
jgi:hypothetical protein